MLQVGKRHRCEECGIEVLVTKASEGSLSCHSAEMALLQPKKVASSD